MKIAIFEKKYYMDSIRIKNLHCLADTGAIPLKPINILVGAISSGKSSFLRVFPLLKQGLNTNKRGPILWLSEDVDFGDFKTAVKRGEKNIELQFDIPPFNVTINIVDSNTSDYINDVTVVLDDQTIRLVINNKGEVDNIIINEEIFCKNIVCTSESRTNILPSFYIKESLDVANDYRLTRIRHSMLLDDDAINFIDGIVSHKLSPNTISNIREKIGFVVKNKAQMLQQIKRITKPVTWHAIVDTWSVSDKDFISLNNRLLLSVALPIIDEINNRLTRYFRGVSYVGPIRATAERYYRRQNLALSSIDSRGINLPMFINDLNEMEKRDLKDWMIKYFDFYLLTDYSGGHIAISLVNSITGEKTNLADSGFGFSQIMPIIVILWTLTSKRTFRRRTGHRFNDICYYVIEQPELHLHPAFQAKLADVFISVVKLAKENDLELKLILETHSESIINRIGRRISEQKFSKEDVTVALFENVLNKDQKNVTLAEFDDDGLLDNWPIGFFNAD